MLLLTRKMGQIIYIGDDITVTIDDVEGNDPRVEVTAPGNMRIHRVEVFYRVQTPAVEELSDIAMGTLIC